MIHLTLSSLFDGWKSSFFLMILNVLTSIKRYFYCLSEFRTKIRSFVLHSDWHIPVLLAKQLITSSNFYFKSQVYYVSHSRTQVYRHDFESHIKPEGNGYYSTIEVTVDQVGFRLGIVWLEPNKLTTSKLLVYWISFNWSMLSLSPLVTHGFIIHGSSIKIDILKNFWLGNPGLRFCVSVC